MKQSSCIRDTIDQQKIDSYSNLIAQHKRVFEHTGKIIALIGNDVRLKIIWLITEEYLCVCDLADILQMSVPAVSQHLRKLKDADIIISEKVKQTIYYRISDKYNETVTHLLKLIPKEISI